MPDAAPPIPFLAVLSYIAAMSSFRTSGDAIADRRFAYAMDYRAQGEPAAAAELVEQALERAPGWAVGWFALGELREAAGDRDKAQEAYRHSLALDLSDVAGAGARLARLGAAPADGAMTAAHVAALFDDYAPRFERSLVGDLSYRGPALLLAALAKVRQPAAFGRALDIGCGTGLAGETFATLCAGIEGCDLSQAMLAEAARKQVYRHLVRAEAVAFLAGEADSSADLILAADVFVYLGDLGALFRQAARVLQQGGLFAFTAQRQDGPEPFTLNHDTRYAHSHGGIEAWAAAAGMDIRHRSDEWARFDRGAPSPGMVIVLQR
ncbi:methyltransferase [Labrys miyagiensis]